MTTVKTMRRDSAFGVVMTKAAGITAAKKIEIQNSTGRSGVIGESGYTSELS